MRSRLQPIFGRPRTVVSTRRTKYLGDWSAACILGLLTGLTILILQRYMSADAVHQLLTFNPADFFTCAQGLPLHSHACHTQSQQLNPFRPAIMRCPCGMHPVSGDLEATGHDSCM